MIRKWYDKGIIYIHQLQKGNDWLAFHEFSERYKIKTNFLTYICLIKSISCTLRNDIKIVTKDLSKYNSKFLYTIFVNCLVQLPTCITKWCEKYNIIHNVEEWNEIFSSVYKETRDPKLWELQYKIVHRIYATDSLVSNFDQSVKSLCQYCNVKMTLYIGL